MGSSSSTLSEENIQQAGKVFTGIGLFMAVIIGTIFIIIGVYLIKHPDKKNKSLIANITKANCTKVINYTNNNQTITYQCDLDINYTINNQNFVNKFTENSSIDYTNEKTIKIYYDPNNPNDISTSYSDNPLLGYILIGVALFIILISGIWYWASRKSKFVSELAGIKGSLDLVTGGKL